MKEKNTNNMLSKMNPREIIQEERKNNQSDKGSKDTNSEKKEDIESKF